MENVSFNRVVRKGFGLKLQSLFALSGLLFFMSSLFMPALRIFVLGGPAEFTGLQANAWAIVIGFDLFSEPGNVGALTPLKNLLVVAAGWLNIFFVVGSFILILDMRNKSLLCLLVCILILGLGLGVAAPFVLIDFRVSPLVGYFSWLLGYLLLIAAAFMAMRK